MSKLFKISEVSKMLELIDKKTNKPLNHVIRYWEKEFDVIKPQKINNRRYYSFGQIEILKMIKYLLKNKGMTISGAKKMLKNNRKKLDDNNINSLKTSFYRTNLKFKSKNLLDKIRKIKSHGKKNTS